MTCAVFDQNGPKSECSQLSPLRQSTGSNAVTWLQAKRVNVEICAAEGSCRAGCQREGPPDDSAGCSRVTVFQLTVLRT